jgi:hypothetical protein
MASMSPLASPFFFAHTSIVCDHGAHPTLDLVLAIANDVLPRHISLRFRPTYSLATCYAAGKLKQPYHLTDDGGCITKEDVCFEIVCVMDDGP